MRSDEEAVAFETGCRVCTGFVSFGGVGVVGGLITVALSGLLAFHLFSSFLLWGGLCLWLGL